MKKIFLFLCVLSISCSSCGQSKNDSINALRQDIINTNNSLPIEYSFFSMDKVEIKGGNYNVYITIDENEIDFDQYVSDLGQNMLNAYSLVIGSNESFSSLFIESGLNICFVVTGKLSKRKEKLILLADEIRKIGSSYSARDYISSIVDEMNHDLPEDWGDGLYLTSVYIEDDYMCYKIMTDDTVITIPLLHSTQEEGENLAEYFIEALNEIEDPLEQQFIRYLKQSGFGLKYIFWSKEHSQSVVFSVSSSTLRSKIHLN